MLQNEHVKIYELQHNVHRADIRIIFLIIWFVGYFTAPLYSKNKELYLNSAEDIYNLQDYAEVVLTNDSLVNPEKLRALPSVDLSSKSVSFKENLHWLKFTLVNPDTSSRIVFLSIAFSDYNFLYVEETKLFFERSGDLVPLKERKIKTGQFCFIPIIIKGKGHLTCYLKLQSTTSISNQFKHFTLNTLKIYTEKGYKERFDEPRIFHAFFFGAVLIMLVFNLFIFFSTRSLSYFYYVCFLALLALFLAANSGYVLELFLGDYPRLDLYVRFLSAPLLVISYILFSLSFLEAGKYSKKLKKILDACVLLFVGCIIIMVFGLWKVGRSAVIITSIVSFFLIFYAAFKVYRKGYRPATYFLAGNLLLIFGGLIYAAERLFIIPQNLIGGYNLQVSSLLEIVLFSFGLADRINFTQKELNEVRVENERKSKEAEIEKKIIVEEKNKELQLANKQLDAFIYRTAHDLRGPLARVLGMTNVAIMDVQDDKALDYLKRVAADANQLNFILKRLSVIYDISTKTVEFESIDLKEIADKILNELNAMDYSQDVVVQLDVQSHMVNSDVVLLRFILQNLLENAFKFRSDLREHYVKLMITVEEEKLIIKVIDAGIGIQANDVNSIFELFSKAALRYQTPGLGLYMVRVCAEKLGGKIILENISNPTIFRVELPR